MEASIANFSSSHHHHLNHRQIPPRMLKKPSIAQQRKEQLQTKVSMHEKMLSHQQQIHEILQYLHVRKDTTPLHIPDFIPPEVKDLVVEIATVEDEILRLENQIQNLQAEVTEAKETNRKQSQNAPTTTTNNDGYFCLQQLISRNNVESSDLKGGIDTKALKFISKAINGSYSLSDFSDKPIPSKEVNRVLLKETSFQERLTKRSSSVLKPSSSPLRDPRFPTPRPKDRINLVEIPNDIPRKPMTTAQSEDTKTAKINQGKVVPNKLSENITKCLILIFVRLMRTSKQMEMEKTGPVSTRSAISSVSFRADVGGNNHALSTSLILQKECSKQQDPYGVFDVEDSNPRDIGPYKNLVVFSSTSLDPKCVSNATSMPLFQKLRGLLNSLQTADLRSLSDQQKLAFWINMYNSCIMHGYLQYGVPSSPAKLLSLMNKSTLNIGGNVVNAQAIEHYILRKHSSSSVTKEMSTGGMKGEKSGKETVIRGLYGLESPNPNAIFALSCGTRSSPAVRIYTSEGVMSELEKSKLDYLQASLSVTSTKKIALPELLVQNMAEFAGDMEALLEWVCQQLPASGSLRKSIVDCFRGQTQNSSSSRSVTPTSTSVINLPYEFDFQYLLAI